MKRNLALSMLAAGAVAMLVPTAIADGLRTPPVSDPVVAKECSACHMLYPAGLLPARSWGRLMGDLKNHFGDNAELDAETTSRILTYLTTNAADQAGRNPKYLRGLPTSAAPLRITELPSWLRKHDKKDRTSPATLARKGAKFKGDCAACHRDAAQGYFEDD